MTSPLRVRLARLHGLYAVLAVDLDDMWLAGLLTEANRVEHVARNGWVVVK